MMSQLIVLLMRVGVAAIAIVWLWGVATRYRAARKARKED
jgi:hypothetical protein